MEKVIIKAEWPFAKKVHIYMNNVVTCLKHLSIEDIDAILNEGLIYQKTFSNIETEEIIVEAHWMEKSKYSFRDKDAVFFYTEEVLDLIRIKKDGNAIYEE
ncbi:MAG: hypothetical protein KA792_00290 [Bacteroidales bacterium]|nr:hypothetical protein [Bacteroidales bacterium]